jgi:hypothetical protein
MSKSPNPCGKWHKKYQTSTPKARHNYINIIFCAKMRPRWGQNTVLVRIPPFENPNRFNLDRTICGTLIDPCLYTLKIHQPTCSHETIFSLQVFKCPMHTLHFKSHLWHLVVLHICELLDSLATTSQKTWACNKYMQVQALRQ